MIHKTKNPWCNCNAYIWYVKVTRMCLHTRKMTNCVFSYVASRFSFITNLLLLEYFFFQKTCILWLPYKKGPFYISSNIERNQINCASFADFWKGKEKKNLRKSKGIIRKRRESTPWIQWFWVFCSLFFTLIVIFFWQNVFLFVFLQ